MALRNRKLGTIEALKGQILQETDAGAVVDNERVYQGGSGTKYEDISSQTYKTSIAKIRASQTLNPNITYITTDFGVPVEWQVDESDTTSVDNTGTILVTADGVRLKARTKGVIDCRQFGIIPDGATPVGDALQSMINSLQNETIELHPGVYILDKKVTIPNNKQLVIRGTGKFEAASPNQAGGVGDGIVTIRYTGTTDDCAIEFLGECRTDLSRFTLVNDSGRNDVDGIKTQDLLRSCIEEVTITRFRRCFWITGWFYYSKFDHCRFRLAYEAGFYAEGLCNGTKFHRCHFIQSDGWGFYGTNLGNPVTFDACWFENCQNYCLEIRNTKQIIIRDTYFENGGQALPAGQAGTIRIGPYSFIDSYVPCGVLISGCHFGGNKRPQIILRGGDTPDPALQNIDLKIESCHFNSVAWKDDDPVPVCHIIANSSKIKLTFEGNFDTYADPNRRYGRVNTVSLLRGFAIINDGLSSDVIDAKIGSPVTAIMDSIRAKSISLVSSNYALNPVNILSGTGSPEGVVASEPGSVYFQTNAGSVRNRVWVKDSGTGNTGWVQFTPSNPVFGGNYQDAKFVDTSPGASIIAFANGSGSVNYPNSMNGGGVHVKRGAEDEHSASFRLWVPNNIGYDGIYAQTLDSLGQWGDMQLLFNPQSVNIAGTTVDLERAFDFWKDITADLTLALSNASDGKKASISIRNTDTNPHTVTITGVQFPIGSNNEIPAGGRAHISLQQINGIIDGDIKIYT